MGTLTHQAAAMKIFLTVLLLGTSSLVAQTTSSTSPKSLEDLRVTYAAALKKLHYPLLQQYLVELQTKRSGLSPQEQTALLAETSRVQSLISGSGVFEPLQKQTPTTAPSSTLANRAPGIILTLEPKEARPTTAVTTGPDAHVLLGTASWRCRRIPAGTYDLVARYEATQITPDAHLTITIGSQTFQKKVATATASGKGRILRLAQFTLEQDLVDSDITLTSSPASPWFKLRTAFVAKPQSDKK
jgi:hypothetical protein